MRVVAHDGAGLLFVEIQERGAKTAGAKISADKATKTNFVVRRVLCPVQGIKTTWIFVIICLECENKHNKTIDNVFLAFFIVGKVIYQAA